MEDEYTKPDPDEIVLGEEEEIISLPEDPYKKGRLHGFLWGIGTTTAVIFIFRRWL